VKTVPIAPADLTWLNMDRPENLMVVNGLMWFSEEPDWDAVRSVVRERLVDRYPVLHRRPLLEGRRWVWVDDPDFDLDRHLRRVTLPAPGDRAVLTDHISARASEPMDRSHPLWEMDLISGYRDDEGQQGAAVVARFHHALADGIRIVQLVLGLCDDASGVTPPVVGRSSGPGSPVAAVLGAGRRLAGEVISFTGEVVTSAPSAVVRMATGAGELGHEVIREGVGLVARPTRITDAITGLADEDNLALNTARSAARLTLWGHDSRVIADRPPGVAKRISWIEGLDLDQIKAIGRAHGATVNDVLLGAASLGMTRYLAEKGRTGFGEASFLVPVSLKPVDASLPAELGNHFAMVMFPMPLDLTDLDRLLPEVHSRMTRIKNSAEAMLIFGAQRAVAATPSPLSERITAFVADKTVGVLTNVPGPTAPIALAGTQVAGVLGWVPTASDQSLGLCILSYAGEVNIGVSADAGIMPDPERLAALIVVAVAEMASAT
jgi:diacylglycerol O-acyltransferase